MSMQAIQQLNNGGLKIKSNFTAKSVAKNITANRAGVSSLFSSNYSAYNSNILFTKSNPIGRNSRYLNAGQISKTVNRPAGQRTWIQPPESGYSSYSQGFSVNTNSVSIGQALGTLLGMAPVLTSTIGSLKPEHKQGAGEKLNQEIDNTLGTISSGNFASTLSGATSFTQITKIEAEIAQKKTNLNTDYQKIATNTKQNADGILHGKGVTDGFRLAGADLDTSVLQLSELNSENLEECMQTIDGDIKKFGDFNTSTLPQSKAKITAKSGQITGELNAKTIDLEQLKASNKDGANNAEIAKLEGEIKELKAQKEQLKSAENAVDQITKECESAIKSLEAKKTEIADVKNTEDNMKDKKYDLAKSQDAELKESMAKIDKINQEIEKLSTDKNPDKYDKSDETRAAKMNSLMSQRSSLYAQLGKLAGSLSGAEANEFENSKHQKYKIQNLDKAMDIISSKPPDTEIQKEKVIQNDDEKT